MMTDDILKMPGNANKYYCKTCDFKCSKQSNYNTHILTPKHQNGIKMISHDSKKMQKDADDIICICGNIYKYKSGLYRHKKICQKMPTNIGVALKSQNNIAMTINEIEPSPTILTNEMVMNILSQNSELIKLLEKQNQVQQVSVSSKVINNTRNFNLNVYLNEVCKEALNLSEFVEGLKVKLLDLEETAQRGYTEGVSRIFINGLNELSENKRPIHCSDLKREVLYIKNEDEWRKEDGSKKEITRAIKRVSNKNIRQINEWQKKYPEFRDPESKESDRYMEMICNTMGGSTDEEQHKNMEKIIRNISREVVIDKSGVLKVKGGGI